MSHPPRIDGLFTPFNPLPDTEKLRPYLVQYVDTDKMVYDLIVLAEDRNEAWFKFQRESQRRGWKQPDTAFTNNYRVSEVHHMRPY